MKRLLWTGLLLIAPWTVAQNHEEKRTRSTDGTRDAVELSGSKSQKHLEKLLTHDREIQEAADFLRQKGYRPLDAVVVYTERIGRGIPTDHAEGTVILWRWEDYDANRVTGILYAQHAENGNTEVNAVQLDAQTGETAWRFVAEWKGRGKKARAFYGPSRILPATYRDARKPELQLMQTECQGYHDCGGLDYRSYYACASWGCGSAAIVGFLLGPAAGPPAFFGGCTGAMIGCLQKLF